MLVYASCHACYVAHRLMLHLYTCGVPTWEPLQSIQVSVHTDFSSLHCCKLVIVFILASDVIRSRQLRPLRPPRLSRQWLPFRTLCKACACLHIVLFS